MKIQFIAIIIILTISYCQTIPSSREQTSEEFEEYIYFDNIKIVRPLTDEKILDALKQYRAKNNLITASQITKIADIRRGPDKPFKFNIDLDEIQNQKIIANQQIKVYVTDTESEDKPYQALVKFLYPSQNKGKIMLRNGNKVWFYAPGTRNPIRISNQQRLMGQVSNGDVVSVNFRLDYKSILIKEERVVDHDYYVLMLQAKNNSVTYSSIEYWVQKENIYPLMAKFYAKSGRLLKTAFYKSFKKMLEVSRCDRIEIVDGINKNLVTVMKLSDMELSDLPRKYFQESYLQYIK